MLARLLCVFVYVCVRVCMYIKTSQIDPLHKSTSLLNRSISFIANIHSYSHKTPEPIFFKWTTSLNGPIEGTSTNGRFREVLLYICIYVCMYICMYVCTYVCIYV